MGDDEAAEFYLYACEALHRAGYVQYEVSNFAAKGDRSRHNLKYWQDVPYLGLGPGASSYDGRVDRRNVRSLAAYHRRLAHGELPVAETQAYPSARRRIATPSCCWTSQRPTSPGCSSTGRAWSRN